MILTHRIREQNLRTGRFEVIVTSELHSQYVIFDLRIINSRAFISERIYSACVKCLVAAPKRYSIYSKDYPKEIAREVYEHLKNARERYQRIEANKRKNAYV